MCIETYYALLRLLFRDPTTSEKKHIHSNLTFLKVPYKVIGLTEFHPLDGPKTLLHGMEHSQKSLRMNINVNVVSIKVGVDQNAASC